MEHKNWIKRGNCNTLEEYFLSNMKVSSLEDVNQWCIKSANNGYRIDRLEEAAILLKEFKDKKVTIVGDYDADGCTSTSILLMGLREYGFTNVSYRIPKRFSEGFGINMNIIDEIDDGLIITCDNGIAAIEEIKAAKEKGLTVIITDHHEPVVEDNSPILPPADIIVDPAAIEGSADFNGYCGAGLAYRLISQLFNNDNNIKTKYAGLAAIGTIGDVMEIREENYVIVRRGIIALSSGNCTAGANELMKLTRAIPKLTAEKIAFQVAPTLNALSRLDDCGSTRQVELLTFDGSPKEAEKLAEYAVCQNETRKTIEKELEARADKALSSDKAKDMNPIMIMLKGAHEGVIGIVAGHLAEKYKKPALVFTNIKKDGTAYYKGSARTYGNFDIKNAFDNNKDLFVTYGGHKEAAGMTILPENFKLLYQKLAKDVLNYSFEADNSLSYDIEIEAKDIVTMATEQSKYEPYGQGNPKPVFLVKNFTPFIKYGAYRKELGRSGDGIKINGNGYDALNFHLGKEIMGLDEKTHFNFLGILSLNDFNGTTTAQIVFQDYQPLAV